MTSAPPDGIGVGSVIPPALRVTGHRVRVRPVAFSPTERVGVRLDHRPGPSGHRTSRPGTSGFLLLHRIGLASARSSPRTFGSPDIASGYTRLPSAPPDRVGFGSDTSPALRVTGQGDPGCPVASFPAEWGWPRVGHSSGPSGYRTSRPGTPGCLLPDGSGWRLARSSPRALGHRTTRPGTPGCLLPRRIGLASGRSLLRPFESPDRATGGARSPPAPSDRVGVGSVIPPALRVTGHRGRVPPVASCPAGSGWRLARSSPRPLGHRTGRPGVPGRLLSRRMGLASGRSFLRPFGSPDIAAGYHRLPPARRIGLASGSIIATGPRSPDNTAGYPRLPASKYL